MVSTHHWWLWMWMTVSDFRNNSMDEKYCKKWSFSSHPTRLGSYTLMSQLFAKCRSIYDWRKKVKLMLGAQCRHARRFHCITICQKNFWKSSLRRFVVEWNLVTTCGVQIDTKKFMHIRELFEKLAKDCAWKHMTYSMTIEQLTPWKNQCPCIVYMPNKFWVLAEVERKYAVNILSYLAAQKNIQGK